MKYKRFTLSVMALLMAFTVAAQTDNPIKSISLTEEEQQLVNSNNDFAFNLFRQIRGNGSKVISPLSITQCLGMLNNGAAGQTQQEINTVLGFGSAGADAINAFCHKMLTESNTLDNTTKALLANTIYVNKDYQLQDGFVEKAKIYYDATPESRDFGDGQTMDVINQWASDHTEGMIKEILNEDTYNPYAVSYLLNALYFKGEWTLPFEKEFTKDEVFNKSETLPMMHQWGDFQYEANFTYEAVSLPYGNGAFRMSVYLPREGKTLDDVLELIDGSHWQLTGSVYEVDLKLPRFETTTDQGLVEPMSALGMPLAFNWELAEFPYFCNRPVYIGLMKQSAKIKVNESGTEAAAVTIIGMDTTSIPDEKRRATFHANRPFLYIISERSTGAIFFIGQFMGTLTAAVNPTFRTESADGSYYNMSGQRLTTPPTRGIYLHNGKKVMR